MNMRILSVSVLFLFSLFILSNVSFATNRVVNGTGAACTADLSYYSTIQAAIDASSSGDTITICANGTDSYRENVKLNKSGLSIAGYNSSSVINGSGSDAFFINESNNFITNLNFTSSPSDLCIHADKVQNITIYYGYTFNCNHGVYFQSVNDSSIFGIRIYDSDYGIQVDDGYQNQIFGNYINDSGTDGIYTDGLYNSNISFNTVINAGNYGIETYAALNSTINNNTIINATNRALYNEVANNSYVFYNQISSSGRGIDLSIINNTQITNNQISDTGGYGIRLNTVDSSTISENTIQNVTDGSCVFIDTITNSIFELNDINHCPNGYSIEWETGTNNDILNNTLNDSSSSFYIYSNSYSRILGNIVSNTFDDNSFDIDTYDHSNISNNIAYGSSNNGMAISNSNNLNLDSNSAYDSNGGFYFSNVNHVSLNGDSVYNVAGNCFETSGNSYSNTFDEIVGYNCSNGFLEGTSADDGDISTITDSHFYDNNWDIVQDATDGGTFTVSNTMLGDSLVISFVDALDAEWYNLKSTASPATAPTPYQSFHDKYLDAEFGSTDAIIDSFTFHWTDSEASGFDESSLNVQDYVTDWSQMNGTLDSASNSFTIANLSSENDEDVYGLFANLASSTNTHGSTSSFNTKEEIKCPAMIKVTTTTGSGSLSGVSVRLVQTEPEVREITTKTTSDEGTTTLTLPGLGKYVIYTTKEGYTSTDDELGFTYNLDSCSQTVPQPNPTPPIPNPNPVPTNNPTQPTSPNPVPTTPTIPIEPTVSGPDNGDVGTSVPLVVTNCPDCTVTITAPDGSTTNAAPDKSGRIILPLDKSGTYGITLLRDGQTLKTVQIQARASPVTGPSISTNNTTITGVPTTPIAKAVDMSWIWTLILFILILLAVGYYLYTRQKS